MYYINLNPEFQIEERVVYFYQGETCRFILQNKLQYERPKIKIQKKTIDFNLGENGDWQLDYEFKITGSIQYIIILDDKQTEPRYFVVQPLVAKILKQMTIQTILPHSLGKFQDFKTQIQSQVDLGYDAFHFPPIQKLGESPSLYSINDQLQLNPDIFGNKTLEDLKQLLNQFPKQYFFIDILLNHTAYDSEWINKIPDATYNLKNSPHLNVAVLLDSLLADFTIKLARGEYPNYNKKRVETEDDLNKLIWIIEHEVIRPKKYHEYFQFKVQDHVDLIQKRVPKIVKLTYDLDMDENIFIESPLEKLKKLVKITLKGADRYGVHVNIEQIIQFLEQNNNDLKISLQQIEELFTFINSSNINEAERYIQEAVGAIKGTIRYKKIECKEYEIIENAKGNSLLGRYFTKLPNGNFAANNGWIAGYTGFDSFAETDDHHYFRRSIVVWDDLIKIRYGTKKENPEVWNYIKKYVQLNAKAFHGFRLDNAHSTPLLVGEYMMKKARKVNPNILIFSELFTGSRVNDTIFTRQLGINSLLREVNHCDDSGKFNGELYFYSGDGENSIGSLPNNVQQFESLDKQWIEVRPSVPPSLIYEQSHDNRSLIQSHGYKHLLPIAALVTFSNAMGGTCRGYDTYVPYRLSVTGERRVYSLNKQPIDSYYEDYRPVTLRYDGLPKQDVIVYGSWDGWKLGSKLIETLIPGTYIHQMTLQKGYYEYKFQINQEWMELHNKELSNNNHFFEVKGEDIKIHKTLEKPRQILNQLKIELAEKYPQIFPQFYHKSIQSITRQTLDHSKSKILIAAPQFSIPDQYVSIQLPGKIETVDYIFYNTEGFNWVENNDEISAGTVNILQHTNIREFADIFYDFEKRCHILKFTQIPVSLTIIITCTQDEHFSQSLQHLNNLIVKDNSESFSRLQSKEVNQILYSSEPEEKALTGHGLYYLENYRQLIYAGLAGPLSAIIDAAKNNNLGHPLCENLRKGNWLIDYLQQRIQNISNNDAKEIINEHFNLLKQIPRFLIPAYFSMVIQKLFNNIVKGLRINNKSNFKRELQLGGYQFLAHLPNELHTMAAGLPHFTTGWSRCWGRDTFISFRGIYLLNNLFNEAKEAILTFGSCLRHGLIPNLLDSCNNPRYNCRDACWWYIKAIKDYLDATQDYSLLNQEVQLAFLDDDIDKHYQKKSQNIIVTKSIQDIIQNIVQSHATGVRFREWRAGNAIDQNMSSEGFNIQLQLDEETGFIVGGNWRNCLTWMDKMGSSEEAGNKGIPATSRDGAPIEMTALLKVCLDALNKLNQQGKYKYEGVQLKNRKLTFKDWSNFLASNFDKYYWIPKDKEQNNEYHISEDHIKHRLIYRDLCKSSKPRSEYQLRCNASIAIGLAPELFNQEKAIRHLATTELLLIKPSSLGLKTLEPHASEYLDFYDNSDQSTTFKLAHGFSYHNGPEWVWVYGFFLKALTNVHGNKLSKQRFHAYLGNHRQTIHQNEWYSLPEMTNSNGEYNVYSCRAQAWSIATILEAVHDFENQQQ